MLGRELVERVRGADLDEMSITMTVVKVSEDNAILARPEGTP